MYGYGPSGTRRPAMGAGQVNARPRTNNVGFPLFYVLLTPRIQSNGSLVTLVLAGLWELDNTVS